MNLIKKILPHFFWLPSVLMIADAVSKLVFPNFWAAQVHINFQDRIIWIGIIELCCALIYLIPITMSVGFFLISCYWGAAIGISIFNEQIYVFALIILVLFSFSFHWRGIPFFFNDIFNKKNKSE